MIFEIKERKDKFLENSYKKSMKELDDFFELGWIKNTPYICIVPDRKTIDKLYHQKTEKWLVAWARASSRAIYILDSNNFEKESDHKYSPESYTKTIKHELAHMFISAYSKSYFIKPYWLNEGVAVYLSGKNKFKKPISKFSKFLYFYDKYGKEIYNESGFFIELLIEKFGKNKLLKLIKSLKEIKSEKEFNMQFKQTYNFNLNYKEINKILGKKK